MGPGPPPWGGEVSTAVSRRHPGRGASWRGETSHGPPLCCVHTRPRRVHVGLSVYAWAPVGGECAQVGPLSGCNSSPLPKPRGPFAGTAKRRDHADCSPTVGPCVPATRPHTACAQPWSQARQQDGPPCHTHTTHMHTWMRLLPCGQRPTVTRGSQRPTLGVCMWQTQAWEPGEGQVAGPAGPPGPARVPQRVFTVSRHRPDNGAGPRPRHVF